MPQLAETTQVKQTGRTDFLPGHSSSYYPALRHYPGLTRRYLIGEPNNRNSLNVKNRECV